MFEYLINITYLMRACQTFAQFIKICVVIFQQTAGLLKGI